MSRQTPSPRVRVRYQAGVATVTVGLGERRNALASEDWSVLESVFATMAGDDELRVVVLRGAGTSFSAGSDLREWVGAGRDQVQDSFERMERAFRAVERLPVPVVAAVDGVAAGAGCQLALACDLQLLTVSSSIGMPIARLGILASAAFAARLTVLAGPAVTRDLLYTGRLLKAPEALAVGLATRCVLDGALEAEVRVLVEEMVAQPAAAVRAAKAAVSTVLAPVRAAAAAQNGQAVDYEQFQAGVGRFLSQRGPAPQAFGTGVT